MCNYSQHTVNVNLTRQRMINNQTNLSSCSYSPKIANYWNGNTHDLLTTITVYSIDTVTQFELFPRHTSIGVCSSVDTSRNKEPLYASKYAENRRKCQSVRGQCGTQKFEMDSSLSNLSRWRYVVRKYTTNNFHLLLRGQRFSRRSTPRNVQRSTKIPISTYTRRPQDPISDTVADTNDGHAGSARQTLRRPTV